jgi:hypothetical protein
MADPELTPEQIAEQLSYYRRQQQERYSANRPAPDPNTSGSDMDVDADPPAIAPVPLHGGRSGDTPLQRDPGNHRMGLGCVPRLEGMGWQ